MTGCSATPGQVAVVSAAKGRVIDFGAAGGVDDLGYVETTAFDGLDKMHAELSLIEPAGEGGRVLHVVHRLLERPLVHHAWIDCSQGKRPAHPIPARFHGRSGAGGHPRRSAGVGQHGPRGSRASASSRSRDPSPALSSRGRAAASRTRRAPSRVAFVARFDGEDIPGFHESARTGEETTSVPAGGSSPRRTLFLTAGTRSLGDAALASAVRCDPE